jgi:hypothetical protein
VKCETNKQTQTQTKKTRLVCMYVPAYLLSVVSLLFLCCLYVVWLLFVLFTNNVVVYELDWSDECVKGYMRFDGCNVSLLLYFCVFWFMLSQTTINTEFDGIDMYC